MIIETFARTKRLRTKTKPYLKHSDASAEMGDMTIIKEIVIGFPVTISVLKDIVIQSFTDSYGQSHVTNHSEA